MNVVITYLLLGCWWERHPFVTPGHTDTGRDDELSGGVKVTEWVNLGISTEAWLRVLDTAGWVSCMVILDHQVEEVLVVGVGVGSRVAGIDTNLAVSMERTWRKQTDDNWQTVKDNSNKGVDNRLPGYGSFFLAPSSNTTVNYRAKSKQSQCTMASSTWESMITPVAQINTSE